MATKQRVAIYARSGVNPTDDHTAVQISECRAFAGGQNWDIVAEIIDEGVSSDSPECPGLSKILQMVETGCVEIVLAETDTRYARCPERTAELVGTCEAHGVALRTAHRDLTDPADFWISFHREFVSGENRHSSV